VPVVGKTEERYMDIREIYSDKARNIVTFQKYLPGMQNILDKLESGGVSVNCVSLDFVNSCIDIHSAGTAGDLAKIFRVLKKAGWDGPKAEEKSASYSGFWKADDADWQIWVSFTSTMCKRVQVGTKLVEQPIYEVVCE
jgi:hypothetical protein